MDDDSLYADFLIAAAVALLLCRSRVQPYSHKELMNHEAIIFFSLHQPITSGNMLDTDKCSCTLSLFE